jgi:hypothetical protein
MDLAEKIVALFRSGPFVQFECEPSTAVWDRDKRVTITAVIFVDPTVSRPSWDPIVTCKERGQLKIELSQDSSSRPQRRVFRGSIAMSDMTPGRYGLELHGYRSQPPIAATTLLILDHKQVKLADQSFPTF